MSLTVMIVLLSDYTSDVSEAGGLGASLNTIVHIKQTSIQYTFTENESNGLLSYDNRGSRV